ncbi:type 4 pilus major pilin [Escherichia coli]|uniref:type 4 pilus major pilin n=1 Tax=Escherichia coli TaxID=562 RepID=UPI0011005811|nr:type 4 pilus major pilin [Escherichia coli]TKJ48316.1 pilus assembly protein [Escherichia coli]TKJ49041.1 pilus assembly protein [Escherichia coli]HCO1556806.1 pilus assembly protein [Escherichia coli]HCQ0823004.1 pilus assembly protein [Escherichia coli]
MHLNFKHTKINNKKAEKGLSLIESAMVLALAATVTAGVMFYYQSASDSNKTQSAISEVMSATSAINGLYIGQNNYAELSAQVLTNSSAIPDNYKKGNTIMNPFGGELVVAAAGNGAYGYSLQLTKLPKSACISLATLNLGTSAAGYGINFTANNGNNVSFNATLGDNVAKNVAITPSEAAGKCTNNNNDNSVTYFMK